VAGVKGKKEMVIYVQYGTELIQGKIENGAKEVNA
jgi:hypothetical protein